MRIAKFCLPGLFALMAMTSTTAMAEDHEIKAQVTKWVPMVLFIQPGDKVTWSNMAGHDTVSIEGMIPEGAEPWQGKMGEIFTHTFEKEGAYIYKCNPHSSLGMIGAVIVGDPHPANLAALEAHPDNKGMIGRTIRKMVKEIESK